eukprot:CAMPEP_0201489720 /NCGR_PEP_ID=MMETSP0151_2-20130828/23438_1 /ASSEMBLY_ACC=CAM_ASM_000257 /TAXON_ID=200890 /ORGANISM="Paramoeba atlantica, Strain 621/1 / CCAP 1560/9" /LENGTH=238 /DNA_ID=CAMNT_0047875405 /DNA_START=122 /DNA_END=838 /DNA_ORIENTATION=-
MKNLFGGIVVVVVTFLFCCTGSGSGQTLPDYGDYFIESYSWMALISDIDNHAFGASGNGVRYYNSQNQRERYDYIFPNGEQTSWFRFYKNETFYNVNTDTDGDISCWLHYVEEEVAPFGSTCEFEGAAVVLNRKSNRWSCPSTPSPYGDLFRTIYTENNRLQTPLREILSFVDPDTETDSLNVVMLLDVSSFEQKKPPNKVFKLPSNCYGLYRARSLSVRDGLFLFPKDFKGNWTKTK